MNAIVVGKQEKVAGGMVFKKKRDLRHTWADGSQNDITIEEFNSCYLYLKDKNGNISMGKISAMLFNNSSYRFTTQVCTGDYHTIYSFFVEENNKTILYCNTGRDSQGGSDAYLSVYAIGTLEIA